MGGAGFPTCVKLKPAKPVDTILLNGCECEPLLTADHRVLLEYADDIIFGLKAVLKTTGAEKGIIVIEDNKPDAIELMQEKVANIGNMDDLNSVLYYGAAGIGLLRSEFQYLGRENYPRENELFLAYKKDCGDHGRKAHCDPYGRSWSRQAGRISEYPGRDKSDHGEQRNPSLP